MFFILLNNFVLIFSKISFSNIVGNDNNQFIGDHNDEDNAEEITVAQVDTLFDSSFF